MALGGDGPYLVAVLWALTGLILFFLFLRLYTRIVCVAAYGIDDHFYVFTCVLIVAYSSLETVAAYHGYGQYDLDGDTIARSTYFRMLGQTFSLIATGASKATVGLFLLRLVVVRWMIIAIWVVMAIMGILSTLATIFTWAACTPVVFTWDERIPGGTCINTVPLAMGLALFTIVADLFFAILPWIFIWKLNIPKREKIILAVSLSLGIFAAAAGAKRIMEVKGVRDVPVGVIVWSQVETAATLVCVGIPVCRPLWTRHLSKFFKSRSSNSYERQDGPSDNNAPVPIGMNTFGGGTMPGAKKSGSAGRGSPKKSKSKVSSRISSLWSMTTTSQAPRMGTEHRRDDNESDEINLTEEQHKVPVMSEGHGQGVPMGLPDDADGNAGAAGAELKRSWILGEGVNQAYIQGDESKEEESKEGIMASRTYEIKRS